MSSFICALLPSLLVMAHSTRSPSVAPHPPIAAALRQTYQQFDQRPGEGWRRIANSGAHRRAARLIDLYAANRRGLLDWQKRNLSFHAGQLYAFAGQTKFALKRFESARMPKEPPNLPIRWNAYVDATIAFLKNDRKQLKKHRDKIAAGPKFRGTIPNLNVVDALLANFGKPYAIAYRAMKNPRKKQNKPESQAKP